MYFLPFQQQLYLQKSSLLLIVLFPLLSFTLVSHGLQAGALACKSDRKLQRLTTLQNAEKETSMLNSMILFYFKMSTYSMCLESLNQENIYMETRQSWIAKNKDELKQNLSPTHPFPMGQLYSFISRSSYSQQHRLEEWGLQSIHNNFSLSCCSFVFTLFPSFSLGHSPSDCSSMDGPWTAAPAWSLYGLCLLQDTSIAAL